MTIYKLTTRSMYDGLEFVDISFFTHKPAYREVNSFISSCVLHEDSGEFLVSYRIDEIHSIEQLIS